MLMTVNTRIKMNFNIDDHNLIAEVNENLYDDCRLQCRMCRCNGIVTIRFEHILFEQCIVYANE